MSNVNVKQINLSLNDITSLPSIFIRELAKNSNSQFFISNALYSELLKNSKRYCIWIESVYNGFQYNDGLEKAFLIKKELNSFEYVMQMNFVSFCNDFKQLTYFAIKGIKYTHFLKGMENIIIIHADWFKKAIYFL